VGRGAENGCGDEWLLPGKPTHRTRISLAAGTSPVSGERLEPDDGRSCTRLAAGAEDQQRGQKEQPARHEGRRCRPRATVRKPQKRWRQPKVSAQGRGHKRHCLSVAQANTDPTLTGAWRTVSLAVGACRRRLARRVHVSRSSCVQGTSEKQLTEAG
jgi:hypothetical protein